MPRPVGHQRTLREPAQTLKPGGRPDRRGGFPGSTAWSSCATTPSRGAASAEGVRSPSTAASKRPGSPSGLRDAEERCARRARWLARRGRRRTRRAPILVVLASLGASRQEEIEDFGPDCIVEVMVNGCRLQDTAAAFRRRSSSQRSTLPYSPARIGTPAENPIGTRDSVSVYKPGKADLWPSPSLRPHPGPHCAESSSRWRSLSSSAASLVRT